MSPSPVSSSIFLGLRDLYVSPGDHIAHFFRGPEERFAMLAPFVKAGLEAGDQCLTLAENPDLSELGEALVQLGVDVDEARTSGQLLGHEGASTPQALRGVFDRSAVAAEKAGRGLVRVAGDMTWALHKLLHATALLEWEAYYDAYFGPRTDFVALCQYDHTCFDGSAVMYALQTHRVVILGGVLQENPFHRDPGEVLAELGG